MTSEIVIRAEINENLAKEALFVQIETVLQNQEGPGYKLQFFFLSTFDDFKWTMQ
jgi:hypothetical protein